jgi:hypothetical protein
MSLSHPKCTDKSFVAVRGMSCNAFMVRSTHNDMNLYAASVALLWSTAIQASAGSRIRAAGPQATAGACCHAARPPQRDGRGALGRFFSALASRQKRRDAANQNSADKSCSSPTSDNAHTSVRTYECR